MATLDNYWEVEALGSGDRGGRSNESACDPMIYPGLYTRSGFNLMEVLARVAGRPDPQVDIGPVDDSCPLVVCANQMPDQPIIYASPAFLELTGYKQSEVLGKNCRFLQAPGGKVKAKSVRKHVSKDTIKTIRKAVERGTELQIEVPNFKKDGSRFTNFLSVIPIQWDTDEFTLSVGFQCDLEALYAA